MRQLVAINDNGGEKRQKEFAMNETCMNHALNMPNIGCCPYCRIAELEQKLADERHDCADLALQVAKLEQQFAAFQGGVEVEGGVFAVAPNGQDVVGKLSVHLPENYIGQRVRVLVMKEVE